MTKISFESFNLNPNILESITKLGYEEPSNVQGKVIPLIFKGKDIIVKSETGSGKTAAFGIPICQNVSIEEINPQALILTPTRELAIQVKEDISNIGRFQKIRCAAIFGKQPITVQIRDLKQRVHVVVGTPGRVLDHIERGTLDLSSIKYLVVDEADKMFNMGFIEEVENILKKLPKNRISLLFSATMAPEIEELCNNFMNNPEKIEIIKENTSEDKIEQYYYTIENNKKFNLLLQILYLEKPETILVFSNTKEGVDTLASRLKDLEYPCKSIHGGMEQKDRISTMKEFKRGEFPILIATDVAARGIHIDDISHVINYDIPLEKESYVHRIGRTGRAGREGKAITFVTPYEYRFLQEIENFIEYKIEEKSLPSKEESDKEQESYEEKLLKKVELKEDKSEVLSSDITKIYINSGKKKKLRPGDIVGAITSIEGVEAGDIGIIDILDYVSYVDILGGKGTYVLKRLQTTPIKGKILKVEKAK